MVGIVFRQESGGAERTVEAPVGQSLMSAAKAAGVPGIEAICGGSMACGTCHVHVDPDWFDKLPPASAGERDILDCTPEPLATVRLTCQITVTEAMDGLIVTVPESQF